MEDYRLRCTNLTFSNRDDQGVQIEVSERGCFVNFLVTVLFDGFPHQSASTRGGYGMKVGVTF
jgi:hypothetical protein